MTREEFTGDLLYIYSRLVSQTPIDSLSDDAKVQVIGHLLESSNNALRIMKEMSLFDAQIGEINASSAFKTQQKTSLIAEDAIKSAQSGKDLLVKDAQIGELVASKNYKTRQTGALDDAVRRDTAKITCEALGIIKSAGNNAGAWWEVASASINALAGKPIASVTTDP